MPASCARSTSSGRTPTWKEIAGGAKRSVAANAVLVERPDRVVDRERPVGPLAQPAPLGLELRQRADRGAERAEPARLADRHGQLDLVPWPERGAEDRHVDPEQVAQRRAQHDPIIVGSGPCRKPSTSSTTTSASWSSTRRRSTSSAPPCSTISRPRSSQVQEAPPRALILRAQGDVVSAGVDVHVFEGLGSAGADALTARLLRFAHAIEDLPLPTLAVAHGLCLTAALELSLACDLLWAGEGVQFGLVEAVVGITPLMGGTQRIAERAGSARAREFVMTGGLFTAETLHDWGVVNRVLPGRGAARQGAAVRRAAGRRPDAGARRHEADRAGAGRPRHARRRRAHRGADVTSLRYSGHAERGALFSGTRTRQGKFHGAVTFLLP